MMRFVDIFAIGAIALLAILLPLSQLHAEEKCQLVRAAKLDVTVDSDGQINVPMTINGQVVHLLVDTGGYVSVLTKPTVEALGLHSEQSGRELGKFYGGEIISHYVRLTDVDLGGLKARSLYFFVMAPRSSDWGGILGPDILARYDADFDFANGTLSLFLKDHCEGRVVYWTRDDYGTVTFQMPDSYHIDLPVQLDGKEVRAMIDTGASETVANLEHIESTFDINENTPDMKLIPGRDPARPRYRYPFKTLTFDSVTVSNPDIVLVPDDQSRLTGYRMPTVVLGMNVLRHLHLYIAYGERKIYVTPASAH